MMSGEMQHAPLYAFDITLHVRPAEAIAGDTLADAWGTWPTLAVPKAALSTPMSIEFDDALQRRVTLRPVC